MSKFFSQATINHYAIELTEWLNTCPMTSWYFTNPFWQYLTLGFEWLVGLVLVVAVVNCIKEWGFKDFCRCAGWGKYVPLAYLVFLSWITYGFISCR
jgi:hypothetical protein